MRTVLRSVLVSLGVAFGLGILAGPARALPPELEPGFDVNHFRVAPGSRDFVLTTFPEVAGARQFGVGLLSVYGSRPLILARREAGELRRVGAAVIEDQWISEIYASVGLVDHLEVAVALPLGVASGSFAGAELGEEVATTAGLGDLRLSAKVVLLRLRSAGVALGFVPYLTLPTGEPGQLRGDGGVTFSPALTVGRVGRRYRAGLEAGLSLRSKRQISNLDIGPQLYVRGGLSYDLVPEEWQLLAEVSGFTSADSLLLDDGDEWGDETPTELLVTARWRVFDPWVVSVGLAAGLIRGYGTPEGRLFGGIAWAPGDRDGDGDEIPDRDDSCPDQAEDRDGFQDADGCPDRDNDGDGVADQEDGCPGEREDIDGFADADGCPDPDNDGDGRMDTEDACPTSAEDLDDFQDEDGCPDPDNDGDGIADEDDHCPGDREDADGFEDADGCPDPDNDSDGIVDASDRCPEAAETVNGLEDEDGCPDQLRVKVENDRVWLARPIRFAQDSDVITGDAIEDLTAVAHLLQANTGLGRIRIETYTDGVGERSARLELSQRRATAVLLYLAGRGVDPVRLVAQGFGPDRPVASDGTPEGRAANNRVVLIVLGAAP